MKMYGGLRHGNRFGNKFHVGDIKGCTLSTATVVTTPSKTLLSFVSSVFVRMTLLYAIHSFEWVIRDSLDK